MHLYEGITAVLLALCTLIRVQGDTDNGHTRIQGPTFFVTDTTRDLTLSCQTNLSAAVDFSWRLRELNPCSVAAMNNCTFRPQMQDDGDNVTCIPQDAKLKPLGPASYELHLKYPPESAVITIDPSQTEPLQQGDVITCTVSGGKPRVTNVTFHCQHPYHADQEDDVSDDRRNVSSSITVNTSTATEVNMNCSCSAHWEPEPGLFDIVTHTEFMLEYKAIVTNFTVNGSTSKTVAESEMVMFRCQGAGRPFPTLLLRKRGNDTAITIGLDSEEGLLHPTGSARCEDLGNYTCEANNNFPNPNSTTVQLLVTCSTRPANKYVGFATMYNLTQAGRTFTVVGYPTPTIAVFFCGNNTDRECQPAAENAFITSCERNVTMEHLVHCTITPVNITEDKTGLYNMTMNNTLGNVTVTFQILHAVTPPVPTVPPADNGLSAVTIVAIAVPTTVGVGLVVIVIVIMVKKKKKANTRKPQQNYENNVFRSESGQTSQRVTATVQPQVHSQALHNQISPLFVAEAGYACPADMLPSGIINPAETSTTKPNPYDPGYASADDIGMSTDAQRVAVSYNPRNNSLKSRSADKSFDVTLQPAEPANKPQDDGVDEYNVLGGQGATSEPDPTYSHINKVNKNQ